MKIFFSTIVPTVLLMGCAATPDNKLAKIDQDDVAAFIELMMGEFQTLPENKDSQILDRRVRVNSPNLEGDWIYTQLNTGLNKKVYRQRISNIAASEDGAAIIQRSYTLKSPEKFADFWGKSQKFTTLSNDDMNRFANEGCVQTWTRISDRSWKGYVDPQTCVIDSRRRNIQIRIEAEASIVGSIYKTNERGFDMEMKQIWGSKPGAFITLERN